MTFLPPLGRGHLFNWSNNQRQHMARVQSDVQHERIERDVGRS